MLISSKWFLPSPLYRHRSNVGSSSRRLKGAKESSLRKSLGAHGHTLDITLNLPPHLHPATCTINIPRNYTKRRRKWTMFHIPSCSTSIMTWTRPLKRATGLPETTILTKKIGAQLVPRESSNAVLDENLKVEPCKPLKCEGKSRGMTRTQPSKPSSE